MDSSPRSSSLQSDLRSRTFATSIALFSLAVMGVAATLHAGLIGGVGGRRSVGGVIIDGAGVVRNANLDEKRELAQWLRQEVAGVEGDLAAATDLRMVSLKGLQQAIIDADAGGQRIPTEAEFLAGLQRIDYVIVDSEKNDIVIAGPAEPWTVREDGAVVGQVSGHATMRLADLATAMRGVRQAANEGISCSIEPTPEGRRELQQLMRRIKLRPGQNPAVYESAMKEAFGPQMIHLTGVAMDSRYARTMVAADFEMKRVAMGLTHSGVAGLPSYLAMGRNSAHAANQNPRWWMACDYEDLARNEDGTVWKLAGKRIKTMTEQDLINEDGSAKAAGATDKVAQAWADKMNENLDALSAQMPVFGELQNVMDATVVATLIVQERLAAKANLDLSVLNASGGPVSLASYDVPRSVDPQCSFIKGRKGWVVTASGGVDINAFEVVRNQTVASDIGSVGEKALADTNGLWWWDRTEG